jgi:hypothetical protein
MRPLQKSDNATCHHTNSRCQSRLFSHAKQSDRLCSFMCCHKCGGIDYPHEPHCMTIFNIVPETCAIHLIGCFNQQSLIGSTGCTTRNRPLDFTRTVSKYQPPFFMKTVGYGYNRYYPNRSINILYQIMTDVNHLYRFFCFFESTSQAHLSKNYYCL